MLQSGQTQTRTEHLMLRCWLAQSKGLGHRRAKVIQRENKKKNQYTKQRRRNSPESLSNMNDLEHSERKSRGLNAAGDLLTNQRQMLQIENQEEQNHPHPHPLRTAR